MLDQQIIHVNEKAQQLVCELVDHFSAYDGGGPNRAIYDTAWVSMVAKKANDQIQWCFPSSFSYILHKQQSHGGWASSDTSEVVEILNTLVALLTLCKHERRPYHLEVEPADGLRPRILRAVSFLEEKLQKWDLIATKHAGFEILVPALMEQLEEYCISFDFPNRQLLRRMNQEKLSKFDPAIMYGSKPVAALRYLEAFAGKLDFDRISIHKVNGSIIASPSATAAFLMHTSIWHDDSQTYLQHTIDFGGDGGNGAVASALTSTFFELCSIVSTLLESGFTQSEMGCDQLSTIAETVAGVFLTEKEVLGSVPAVCFNADESAMAVITLNLLGRKTLPDSLIQAYEEDGYFMTYVSVRDSSFITNCNVLHALLRSSENPKTYTRQIEKVIGFLCTSWWESDGPMHDKSHFSPTYPTMLISRAFVLTLVLWDGGALPHLSKDLLRDKMLITLFQSLVRTLQTQNGNGSWGQTPSREETAFALLTIVAVAKIPFATSLRSEIDFALEHGREYLLKEEDTDSEPENLGVAELTYGSQALSQSFFLGALKSLSLRQGSELKLEGLDNVPLPKIAEFTEFYLHLPVFAKAPEWCIRSSLVEGYLFLPQLRKINLDIFPRHGMRDEKYIEFIPFTWIALNNLNNNLIPTSITYDMMVLAVLIYQVDEYMEAVIGTRFRCRFDEVRNAVHSIFQRLEAGNLVSEPGPQEEDRQTTTAGSSEIQQVHQTITNFVLYTLRHPRMQKSSDYGKRLWRTYARAFLLAHITQAEDNYRLFHEKTDSQGGASHPSPTSSFFDWVRTIGTDHASCSYAFASFICLLERGEDCFGSVEAKYLALDCCQHLGTLCRMYNDYGSARRDRQEKNLNCLDFPEFQQNEETGKQQLFRLAGYVRKCLDLSLAELRKFCKGDRIFQSIKMFCDIADLYGQMYVVKDLTPLTKVDQNKVVS